MALGQCCPSAMRDNSSTKGRRGLTLVEYNKTLERAGFQKVRDRRIDLCPTGSGSGSWSGSGSGSPTTTECDALCLFRFRKWKSTETELLKWELYKSWESLVASFPIFSEECDWNKFFSIVTSFERAWQPNADMGRRLNPIPYARYS